MAILGRKRINAMTCAAGLLLVAVGCAVFSGGRESFAFNHRLHVVDEELDCVICHGEAYGEDDPGMPEPDTCDICHDDLDEGRPEGRRVRDLFEDFSFRAAHHSVLADELQFSHFAHVDAGLECSECHEGIEQNERLSPHIGVTMKACVDCHGEREISADCSTCHTTVDPSWMPPGHGHHWEQRHGDASQVCEQGGSRDCTLCHAPESCADCHLTQTPSSHTNTFRRRSHGLAAAIDRTSCATCHRSDSCNTCHLETRPTSHMGQWGGTKSKHCFGCHVPLRVNSCVVCHQDTPSHLTAAPKPGWHTPGMNCRQCHGLSAPLPHVDNGDDCNACHH